MSNTGPTIRERQVRAVLDDWPSEPTDLAERVMEKYGPPDSVTSKRFVWYGNGPWKRSILRRDGVPHEFPDEHADYFEQVIDYEVPPECCDALSEFNGSIVVRRTRGELSVECHCEYQNFLALNLAHDIVAGDKSPDEARNTLTMAYAKKQAGGNPEYAQGFQFELPDEEQRDPDRRTVDETILQRAEQQVQ